MKTSRFCLGLWKANWLPIGLFFLANIIAFTIAPLILGYQMRWFFDSITLDEPKLKTALALVIWMVILAITRMGFMLARSVFHELTRYVVGTMLRRNILNNILQRRGVRSLGTSSGDVISRFRDDVDLVLQFIHTVGYFGSFFLFCLFGFIVMLAINPVVTWVVILPFLLISVLVTLIKPRIQRLMAKQRDTTARVTGFIGSTFNGIEVIQSAGAEKAVVEEFRQRNQARRQAVVGHQIFSAFIDYLGGSMYFIGMATFLAIAAAPMRNGDFSVGEFALFAHFISYLGAGMRGLTMILETKNWSHLSRPPTRKKALSKNTKESKPSLATPSKSSPPTISATPIHNLQMEFRGSISRFTPVNSSSSLARWAAEKPLSFVAYLVTSPSIKEPFSGMSKKSVTQQPFSSRNVALIPHNSHNSSATALKPTFCKGAKSATRKRITL